jgi:hypothetical protein
MPFGTDFEHPVLSLDDAFDVAVFINGQSRPHKPGIESDYPDLSLKPADAAYPPFADPFSPNQHRVGPWPPIQRWVKENAAPHDSARGKQGQMRRLATTMRAPASLEATAARKCSPRSSGFRSAETSWLAAAMTAVGQ